MEAISINRLKITFQYINFQTNLNFKVEGYDFGILRNKFSLYAFRNFPDGYDVIEIFLLGMYFLFLYECMFYC